MEITLCDVGRIARSHNVIAYDGEMIYQGVYATHPKSRDSQQKERTTKAERGCGDAMRGTIVQ